MPIRLKHGDKVSGLRQIYSGGDRGQLVRCLSGSGCPRRLAVLGCYLGDVSMDAVMVQAIFILETGNEHYN